ncbi:hypothetical protein SARC_00425 [Sphaeroforma arctica JP610]|uniref:Selenoprotein O n=1 Tax=Sphaeroforma arctica JP610 TaxID=667725 RepID=A0A0L0GGJ1_9EUKA|nr:hypothetical protein SARC_00425 [Sphaeroforma arctica JP610]XP_014161345.1 hypothetical protein, variant [Sphaeroforma arctica JP610]KNC87442.1 hypothetical protein, variant [Sphaeroforma arctica JP610]KNC87443.1 hypothetical protein SARC_00425 [Sphaeroforma arctica JP610]|eukprot:XP_014161344.1 hypothetical protein SARC_00425 [Sphaeroforma arctica JP610]
MSSRVWPLALSLCILVNGSKSVHTTGTHHYGLDCSGVCDCAEYEDCDDGLAGDGTCSCAFGQETLCGIPHRLIPTPETPALCDIDKHLPCDSLSEPELGCLCTLDELRFHNWTLRHVSIDSGFHRAPRSIPNATAVRVLPMPMRAACLRLVAFDNATSLLLNLSPSESTSTRFTELFSGRALFPGSLPFAHVYGGHQFGTFSGQLGDGRVISIGELNNWEVSLKGAGRTPLSRAGDGRAVLQSVCREFLASVALTALGVPTTHSLAVLGSDDMADALLRDEWYTGELLSNSAGILVRVAPTFLRFGTFQLAARRQGAESLVKLAKFALSIIADVEATDDRSIVYLDKALAYYDSDAFPRGMDAETQETCFFRARKRPSCTGKAGESTASNEGVLRCLLERVVARSASLVAAWTATGFTHGVMNTDNMSILGITLDLNVFGFQEAYDEAYVPNFIDDEARYAFGNQAHVMLWNLERLADALSGGSQGQERESARSKGEQNNMNDLTDSWLSDRARTTELGRFHSTYKLCWDARQRIRLGLPLTQKTQGDDIIECEIGADDQESGQESCQIREDNPMGRVESLSDETKKLDPILFQWFKWLRLSRADLNRVHRALADIDFAELIQLCNRSLADEEMFTTANNRGDETEASRDVRKAQEIALVRQNALMLVTSAGVSKETMGSAQYELVVNTLESWLRQYINTLHASESTHSFTPHRWQKHMRAVNPSVVLRSRALRKLTKYAAENADDGANILSAVTEMVRHPFNTSSTLAVVDENIEAIALQSLSVIQKTACASTCEVSFGPTGEREQSGSALSSFGVDTLLSVARGLQHAPLGCEISGYEKTSCGGQ